MQATQYSNPLIERYCSEAMSYIFSPQFKFSHWRKLWVALAEAEQQAGLRINGKAIADQQIEQMKSKIDDIDFEKAAEYEKKFRHDVMAHVHTFGDACPDAAAIIHTGATSAFVGDNTDLIQLKAGLELIQGKLKALLYQMSDLAKQHKDLPTLGFTHFQPAQLTTVGKRIALWMQDFLIDYQDLLFQVENLPFRGVKGTTGTQASFMSLFDGDGEKIDAMDRYVSEQFGFKNRLTITGQTYTRKLDYRAMSLLSSIAQSASKLTNDMRLLQHKKEIEEPFEKNQIGSSAMAYKRNPMRSERIGSLARFVMSLEGSTAYTASTQWFERTLDDSANKRLSVAQAFLATDAILDILLNISSGLVVYPKMIHKHIMEELPFMMTENIMMEGVKKGGNRQELHEVIRQLSMQAGKRVKEEGGENNLLELIAEHKDFPLTLEELQTLAKPELYTGRSAELTERFVDLEVIPLLGERENLKAGELRV